MNDPAMKNLLAASVLSVAALAACAGRAPAWFNLGCHHCCSQFCICCRPYNAFSPVCFGNINCVGCCPTVNWGGGGGPGCDGAYMANPAAGEKTIQPGRTAVPFQAPMPGSPPVARPMGYGVMIPAWPVNQPTGYAPAYYPTAPMPYAMGGGY
jgi:hypothetical protein